MANTNKIKTNEQMLSSLLKSLNPIEAAILRERLIKIATMTKELIKNDPSSFENPFVDVSLYESTCDKVMKHLSEPE